MKILRHEHSSFSQPISLENPSPPNALSGQRCSARAIKTILHATLGEPSQKSRPFKYELSVPQMEGSFKLFQI